MAGTTHVEVFARIDKIGCGSDVVVSRQLFRGIPRIDIREFFHTAAEDLPTRRGISLPLTEVPKLRAALEAVEASSVEAGLIPAPAATPTQEP